MSEFSKYNAEEVLKVVEKMIEEIEALNKKAKVEYVRFDEYDSDRIKRVGWFPGRFEYKMDEVFEELSIFDWWTDTLSASQLKQMRAFLKQAIKLGFKGYVCFKVGAKYCANGMWAHTEESTNGYSPDDCDVLFHSFVSDENYWDAQLNGKWLGDKDLDENGRRKRWQFSLKEVKNAMKEVA